VIEGRIVARSRRCPIHEIARIEVQTEGARPMAAPLVVQAGEKLAGAVVDVRTLNFLKCGLRSGQPCG